MQYLTLEEVPYPGLPPPEPAVRTGLISCILNKSQIDAEVDRIQSDYNWKGDLKNERTRRLDMWEEAHIGEIYTSGAIQQYKRLTDSAIEMEKDVRASGQIYRAILEKYINCYTSRFTQSEFSRIDKNDAISSSDQDIEIMHYQVAEREYLIQQQEQQRKLLADVEAKALEELEKKQEREREEWERVERIGIGAILGLIGLGTLAWATYESGKHKPR